MQVMNDTNDIKIKLAAYWRNLMMPLKLFKEYANAINFDSGFKNFHLELVSLNSHYSAPEGCLLLAYKKNKAVGCIAVRKTQQGVAELKRFYVKRDFRLFKIWSKLLEAAVANAQQLHFQYLCLEVIPTLTIAKELYHSFGFYSIKPYQTVILEGTAFMEKKLLTTVDGDVKSTSSKENVWNKIPLEDYEFHMQHASVGQLHVLNTLTNRYLKKQSPEIVMFIGIAGGNGLEHIDNKVTQEVFGIDINQDYLNETEKRFKNQVRKLILFNIDISSSKTQKLTQADFIWAALIFEYVETDACFEFISNNIKENGYLIVTIQENNGVSSVSPTGIETVKLAGQIFRIVSQSELLSSANKFGLVKIDFEENILPNKKSLKTFTFLKKNNELPP